MLFHLVFAGSCSGDLLGQELKLHKIGLNTAIVSGGRQNVNITAFRTSQGIVVIDTGESEDEGRAARELIESNFPEKEFIYIINTHSHWDHISGNTAFPEAKIIGHQKCRELIEKRGEENLYGPENAGNMGISVEGYVTDGKGDLSPPPPAGAILVKEEDFATTAPSITFTDSMSLFCGDTTFRLYYFGETHTASDIIIQIPEAQLLVVGDLFFSNWLPVFSEWTNPDINRWSVINEILTDSKTEYETIVPGHGQLMSRNELEKQFYYRLRLWNSAQQVFSEGKDLEAAVLELSIEKMFPDLASWNIKDSRGQTVHDGNLRAIFRILGKKK